MFNKCVIKVEPFMK